MRESTGSTTSGFIHSVTSDKLCSIDDDFAKRRRLNRLRRGTITSARLHEECNPPGQRTRKIFLTLTYRSIDGWSPRHVSELIKSIREYLRIRGVSLRYTWVMELQKRGAPHYHLLLWVPWRIRLPKPDTQGWWKHGSTNIQTARNPVGYIAKYASKAVDEARPFPKGCRIHGTGGLPSHARIERRWWLSPLWVRKHTGNIRDVGPVEGGGYCDRTTGEVIFSPYVICRIPSGEIIIIERQKLHGHLKNKSRSH
jgi:hypothetical protein